MYLFIYLSIDNWSLQYEQGQVEILVRFGLLVCLLVDNCCCCLLINKCCCCKYILRGLLCISFCFLSNFTIYQVRLWWTILLKAEFFFFFHFSGVHFNSPQVQPTIEQIDMSFGATHPGGLKISPITSLTF